MTNLKATENKTTGGKNAYLIALKNQSFQYFSSVPVLHYLQMVLFNKN
jgi:hypothetical protein